MRTLQLCPTHAEEQVAVFKNPANEPQEHNNGKYT